jgi:23S rRNA (cytosine1962-C5)-methyltransferase
MGDGRVQGAVRLKPGREKSVLNRHPWLFSGAVGRREGSPRPGDTVDVLDSAGGFLARGYYNPRSQIVVRLLTWDAGQAIDAAFWEMRLGASMARREALSDDPDTTAFRLVYAESDGLPGLIVDLYDEWVVLQVLTLGLETHKKTLVSLLREALAPKGIIERSDVDVRAQEGLPPLAGALHGETPSAPVVVRENGLRFGVDLLKGHKTGFYLDQRENRRRVAAYAAGSNVLNVFSYTGGFAVYAAATGAAQVTNLDSSADALREAEAHLRVNDLSVPAESIQGDAFQVLRQLVAEGRQYDLVILDPPKFAFSKGQLNAATRGYKDINMLGMRLLRPCGTLATFSCSGLVSEDLFQKVLFGASVDVRREVRILERLGQGGDHPVLLTFPEGAYLKGFICRVE